MNHRMEQLKIWAKALKRDVMTLRFALKHPDTPWYARILAAVITAYALSPIDLISLGFLGFVLTSLIFTLLTYIS